MAVECWWRNPRLYIRELVSAGSTNVIFDKGFLVKHRIEPLSFLHAHFGNAMPFRLIVVGDDYAAEFSHERGPRDPIACYPVWRCGQKIEMLEYLLANPVGDNLQLCLDPKASVEERPAMGQEHRVFVSDLPADVGKPQNRRLVVHLADLADEAPDALIHIHGLYSFSAMFGQGFGAADFEPRNIASSGLVMLPNGKKMNHLDVDESKNWIRQLGFTKDALRTPKNRCLFNIKSAEWAAKHFLDETKFAELSAHEEVDLITADDDYVQPSRRAVVAVRREALAGDKMLCNMCSLQNSCSYFREGMVCSLPESDAKTLASMFKTRDSATIVDGLGMLLALNVNRAEAGVKKEQERFKDSEFFGEEDSPATLDPEVTKIINNAFKQGVQLAQLIDPGLRGGPTTKVNILNAGSASTISTEGAAQAVAASTPQEITGAVVRELESKGIRREDITPALIASTLEAMGVQVQQARQIEQAG